jgi:Flp pilus assembly pilin Flp
MLAQIATYLKARIGTIPKAEEGQTIVEYVLLIVLVGLAVAVASPSITNAVLDVFSRTSSVLAP